jgi:transposase
MSECTLEREESAQLLKRLPQSYKARWSSERKALVVEAVQTGAMSFAAAQARYRLSRNEYLTWEDAFGKDGVKGAHARNRLARGG